MSRYIDLSHSLENGMPAFRMRNPDGTSTQFSASIKPFLTHEQSKPKYDSKAAFEITELNIHTSVGTYLDSPYHRYPEMRDISELLLEELILTGIVIDVRGRKPFEPVGPEVLPLPEVMRGKAVLFCFGWDAHWGKEEYYSYPFISRDCVETLIAAGVKIAGVDTINIDDNHDPERPAHSWLLKKNILVVENLCNLAGLIGKEFRFYCVPVKGKKVAAMPVRAFGEVQ